MWLDEHGPRSETAIMVVIVLLCCRRSGEETCKFQRFVFSSFFRSPSLLVVRARAFACPNGLDNAVHNDGPLTEGGRCLQMIVVLFVDSTPTRDSVLYVCVTIKFLFSVLATSCFFPAALLQDNNSIYYEPVPEFDLLDPLPTPVIMMKPLPSVEEPPPTETLSFRATGSSEVGGEGEVGAAEGGDKTDEEIARALHEKLNT